MQSFTDSTGDIWNIDLNIRTVRDIRRAMAARPEDFAGVDFLDFGAVLYAINDVFFAADLLALILSAQITARGLDDAAFGERLRGKVLFEATEALTAEYLDFFPDPAVAEKIRAVVEKNKAARAAISEAIVAAAETEFEREVENVATQLGGLSSAKSGLQAETSPDSQT